MNAPESEKVIDFDHLKNHIGDDVSIIAEVFGLFKHQVEMWSKMLDAHVDDESWVSVMHSLKGTSGAVGAHSLSRLCEKGEAMIGTRGTIAIRQLIIDDVQFDIEQVKIEIGRWEYRQKLASMRS
ncbi:MAG: Hpt domain-containing protein [Robiginitomaculum sp.]